MGGVYLPTWLCGQLLNTPDMGTRATNYRAATLQSWWPTGSYGVADFEVLPQSQQRRVKS